MKSTTQILLAVVFAGLGMVASVPAHAFCFTAIEIDKVPRKVSLGRGDKVEFLDWPLVVNQLTWKQYESMKADPLAAVTGEDMKSIWRDITGSGRFAESMEPDERKCCKYTDKSCNPGLKKDGDVIFHVRFVKPKDLSKAKEWLELHLSSSAGVHFMRGKATDHFVCDQLRSECQIYKGTKQQKALWPNFHTSEKNVMLVSKHSGKCLEIRDWNKEKGANVGIWACTGKKNQRWQILKTGYIRSEFSGKCLDAAKARERAENGQNVLMWDCHDGANQQWRFDNKTGNIALAAPDKNKKPYQQCLDVKGWDKKDGANVDIWQCGKNQANQNWSVKR